MPKLILAAGTLVSILSMTGDTAYAVELDWILNMRTLASNNIYRVPVGTEIPGALYQLTGGLQIEDLEGYNTYSFSGEAGRERIETTPQQEETPIYRLGGNISWTSRRGGFLEVIGSASRETNTLQPLDFNQLRSLEERIDGQITAGKIYKSGGGWQGSLIGNRLDRDDLVVNRIGIGANATMLLNRSTDVTFEGLTTKGYGFELFSEDEWLEGFIDLEYLHRTERNLSLGSSFYWYSADTASTSTDLSPKLKNFHLTGFFQTFEAVNMPFSMELGVDGINNVTDEWDWDWYCDFSIAFPLVHEITSMGRRAEFRAQAVYQAIVDRANEKPVSLGRLGSVDAIVVWRPAQALEFDGGIVYALQYFSEEELLPDRDEEHRTATVSGRWLISQGITLRIAAILDQIDSELNTRDLEEKRIEMDFTAFF